MSSTDAGPPVPRRWIAALSVGAACAAVVAAYAPAVSLGPVCEDLQWALKGAATPLHPAGLLKPFHQHLRPAGNLLFAGCVAAFGSNWTGYRIVHLALVVVLALLGFRFLGRSGRLPPVAAGAAVALWLISPLSDDVVLVTNGVKPVVLGIAILTVLSLRVQSPSPARRFAIAAAAALAAATKEEWVVLPGIVLAQDVLLLSLPFRRALRRVTPWAAAVVCYLAAYWELVRFQAGWFYAGGVSVVLTKAVATTGAFLHVLPPVPWEFGALLAGRPAAAALAVALAIALVGLAVLRRERRALFCLIASAALALPTLPGSGQAGRYTLLPWFFFLAGSVIVVREVGALTGMRRLVNVAAGVLASVLLAADALCVRGDCEDWARFAAIGRQLEAEATPLLERARQGSTLVVVRGDDGAPLRRLLESPRGRAKLYFPRPDDPYGVVSLSALLSWRTYREGFVLERVASVPPDEVPARFVHEAGGFRAVPGAAESVDVVRSAASWQRKPVILVRRPWAGFDPAAFP